MSSTGPAAVLEAAELCSVVGDHADAAHLLTEALVTGPSDPALLCALAEAQFAIGWDGCALALLAEAHRVAPGDERVVAGRNHRLREHGRFAEALAALGTLPADSARTPALRAGTYDAMSLPVLAVESDPTGRRGLWWRTGGPLRFLRARRRRHERELLADLPDPAGLTAPVDVPALLTRIVNGTAQDRDALAAARAADEHLDDGRQAAAAAVLAEALRRDCTHPLLLRHAARVAERLDRPGPALALHRRLAVDPTPLELLVRQGELLIEMELLPEAVQFVEGLPAETARAAELRRVVADAYRGAGLPAAAAGADGRSGIAAMWHRPLWWRTGGPVRALRRRLRFRDWEVVSQWTPRPLEELLGSSAAGTASDLMAAAARTAAVQERAERAAETGGAPAAIDVLAAECGQDPHLAKDLAQRLYFEDREEESLGWFDRAAAADPVDLAALDGRLSALLSLDRTREALQTLEAMPPAVRAAPAIRIQESWLHQRQRLWTSALDVLGPAATTPPWLRRTRRRLWWRTGGPLWMLRSRLRASDAETLAAWRVTTPPLLSILDGVVPAATPAMRTVVDAYALDHETRTLLWERANVVARLAAGWLAAATAGVLLARTAATETGLPPGWAALTGAAAACLAYLVVWRWLFRFTRVDDRRALLTRAVPLIVGFAVAGAVLYRGGHHLAGGTVAAVAVTATARLAAAAACRVVAAWAMRRFRRGEPRAVALTEALAMLGELRQAVRRNELRWRRFWLARLERIAYAMEHDLPTTFGLVDPDTHRQLTDGGRAAARAVRQLKFLVAAPSSPDAWRRVEDVLRHNAGALATGELGRLRRAEPVAVPAPVRRGRRAIAVEVLRVAVFAGLPLAAVYAAQPWLIFSEPVHDWAKVVGLGWALLYVLLHLDPTLREKLTMVLSVFSPGQTPEEGRPRSAGTNP